MSRCEATWDFDEAISLDGNRESEAISVQGIGKSQLEEKVGASEGLVSEFSRFE